MHLSIRIRPLFFTCAIVAIPFLCGAKGSCTDSEVPIGADTSSSNSSSADSTGSAAATGAGSGSGSSSSSSGGGGGGDDIVGSWTFSGDVPNHVDLTLTFNADKTFTFVEEVAPVTSPAGAGSGAWCITTDTYLGTYSETIANGANTLTWTFASGTANAVVGCAAASEDSPGVPMTADGVASYQAQGMLPATTSTFEVTAEGLVLTPSGGDTSGGGINTSVKTFVKSQ